MKAKFRESEQERRHDENWRSALNKKSNYELNEHETNTFKKLVMWINLHSEHNNHSAESVDIFKQCAY